MKHTQDHEVVDGRKPGTSRCTDCNWRFPCPDNDCGHGDCMEFRGELPRCHHCRERVQGSPSGFSFSPCPGLPQLEKSEPEGSWTRWDVHGHTRAVHYCCRDAKAAPHELRRWYGLDKPPKTCQHHLNIGVNNPQAQEEAA